MSAGDHPCTKRKGTQGSWKREFKYVPINWALYLWLNLTFRTSVDQILPCRLAWIKSHHPDWRRLNSTIWTGVDWILPSRLAWLNSTIRLAWIEAYHLEWRGLNPTFRTENKVPKSVSPEIFFLGPFTRMESFPRMICPPKVGIPECHEIG